MTAAVCAVVISALLVVGLAYVIGDACGQTRGHARGYAAGRRDGRRDPHQPRRDELRKQAREAEEAIEYLYRQARAEIEQLDLHPSPSYGSKRP